MKTYRVERSRLLDAIRDRLVMCGNEVENDEPETVDAISAQEAMNYLLTTMEMEFMYDLQDEYIRLWEGDVLVCEHTFSANRVVDQMVNMTEFGYKGYNLTIRYNPIAIEPLDGIPNTPIETIRLYLDEGQENGVLISRFMDDLVLRDRLDTYLCSVTGSDCGSYRVHYSSGIDELLMKLNGDIIDWVEAETAEKALEEVMQLLDPIREYSLEGQWIEVDDGLKRERHHFHIEPEFDKLFGTVLGSIGLCSTLLEAPHAKDLGCKLKPLPAVGRIYTETSDVALFTVSPYWPLKNIIGDMLKDIA